MRKTLAGSLAVLILNLTILDALVGAAVPSPQDESEYQPYSPQQLENLLAPIALYPDPLLAQVLPASTFVDQVQQAAEFVRANGANGIDEQDWDVSVKAVAHYPMVIDMMAQRVDWTTSVGQAYVNQSTDVMTAVQQLRRMARSRGNLYSTPQQQVIYEGGYVQIVPAQPRYIYVPTYDPAVVYFRPHREAVVAGVVIGFTAGLIIGAWLNRDCDWREHRVYYDGWHGDRGWRGRSRQYVQVNNVTYVNNTYNVVNVNKTVVNNTVNVTNINRYNSVHQNITYNNVERNNTIIRNNPNLHHPNVMTPHPGPQNAGFGNPPGERRTFPNEPVRRIPPPTSNTIHPGLAAGQTGDRTIKTAHRPINPRVQNPHSVGNPNTGTLQNQKFKVHENKQELKRVPISSSQPGTSTNNQGKRFERHDQKSGNTQKVEKLDKRTHPER